MAPRVDLRLALLFALSSCAELRNLEANGACGNLIVEAGEDCDGFRFDSEIECGAPGQLHACRFLCPQARCPDGYHCGNDRVCRQPAAKFDTITAHALDVDPASTQLVTADFDGDNRDDLFLISESEARVMFFGADGSIDAEASFPVENSRRGRTIHYLDGDFRADIVLTTLGGLVVLPGRSDRTIVSYVAPIDSTPVDSRYGPQLFALRGSVDRPAERLLSLTTAGASWSASLPLERREVSIAGGEIPHEDGYPPLFAVAELDARPSREELIFIAGRNQARAFELQCDDICRLVHRVSVALELAPQRPPAIADLDGDGNPDLIAGTISGTLVAYGDGRGSFCSVPLRRGEPCRGELDVARSDPRFAASAPVGNCAGLIAEPHQFGDFDGDRRLDYVTYNGAVFFGVSSTSTGATESFVQRGCLDQLAQPPRIADFNDDGIDDLAAIVLGAQANIAPVLELQLGTPSRILQRAAITSVRAPAAIDASDFDGDRLADLAITSDDGQIWILYGDRRIASTEPVYAGQVAAGARVLAGRFIHRDGRLAIDSGPTDEDALDDLLVHTSSGGPSQVTLSLLAGSPQRNPIAHHRLPLIDPATGRRRHAAETFAARLGDLGFSGSGQVAGRRPSLLVFTTETPPPIQDVRGAPADAYPAPKPYLLESSEAFRFSRPIALQDRCPRIYLDQTRAVALEKVHLIDVLAAIEVPGNRPAMPRVMRLAGSSVLECDDLAGLEAFQPQLLFTSDLDGDRRRDLIIRGRTTGESAFAWYPSGGSGIEGAPQIIPLAENFVELEPIQADPDLVEELLVLGDDALRLFDFEGGVLKQIGESIFTFDDIEKIRIQIGDFDGDGLDDLFSVEDGLLFLRRQRPKN